MGKGKAQQNRQKHSDAQWKKTAANKLKSLGKMKATPEVSDRIRFREGQLNK